MICVSIRGYNCFCAYSWSDGELLWTQGVVNWFPIGTAREMIESEIARVVGNDMEDLLVK